MQMRTSHNGFFITLEGIDGSGKSTQFEKLCAVLTELGHDVVAVREPGGTELGEALRTVVLQTPFSVPVDPWAEALLFMAARAQLLAQTVRPALAAGKVVVCDRFVDSTVAYQGAARALGEAKIRELHNIVCGGLWPDLTLIFQLPLETSFARRSRAEGDRMETTTAGLTDVVANSYAATIRRDGGRVIGVDASADTETVAAAVRTVVVQRLVQQRQLDRPGL